MCLRGSLCSISFLYLDLQHDRKKCFDLYTPIWGRGSVSGHNTLLHGALYSTPFNLKCNTTTFDKKVLTL